MPTPLAHYYAEFARQNAKYRREYISAIEHADTKRKRELTIEYERANAERKRQYDIMNAELKRQIESDNELNASDRRKAKIVRNTPIGEHYTPTDERLQYRSQKGKCWHCGVKLNGYHIDHLIPLSRGGTNKANNIVCSCLSCNALKGAKQ